MLMGKKFGGQEEDLLYQTPSSYRPLPATQFSLGVYVSTELATIGNGICGPFLILNRILVEDLFEGKPSELTERTNMIDLLLFFQKEIPSRVKNKYVCFKTYFQTLECPYLMEDNIFQLLCWFRSPSQELKHQKVIVLGLLSSVGFCFTLK